MNSESYRELLTLLDLTQARAAEIFGASERTGRNWARHGPPPPVAVCLRMVKAKRLKLETLESLIKGELG